MMNIMKKNQRKRAHRVSNASLGERLRKASGEYVPMTSIEQRRGESEEGEKRVSSDSKFSLNLIFLLYLYRFCARFLIGPDSSFNYPYTLDITVALVVVDRGHGGNSIFAGNHPLSGGN